LEEIRSNSEINVFQLVCINMTLEHKIGQFFFPAVFINDTEENIKATEMLIKKYIYWWFDFFHSRASAATNYEKNKNYSE
jgi:hypothetical protein